VVKCKKCGDDVMTYFEMNQQKLCLNCYVELKLKDEKQRLNQIKKKIKEWKNEGYTVVDLEKEMESRQEQKINSTDITKKSKKNRTQFKRF